MAGDAERTVHRRWPFRRNRYWTWVDEIVFPALLLLGLIGTVAVVVAAVIERSANGQ